MGRFRTLLFQGQVLWAIFVLGLWTALVVSGPLDPDYAAGEILDHVFSWTETGVLYGPIDVAPYHVLNYPPLYLLLVRWLASAGISFLVAGRIVALAAIVLAGVFVSSWLRRAGCSRLGVVFALSLAGGSFPLLFFFGQFHLQWPAVACTLAGLLLLDRAEPRWAAAAGALLGLACFAKQTQVLSLVMAAAWLLCCHRRTFLPFGAAAAAVTGLGAALLYASFGAEVFRQVVVYTVGTFSLGTLWTNLWRYVVPWCGLLLLGVYLAIRDHVPRRDLRFWYFATTSLSLLTSARAGASAPYFVEWSCAVLLWTGPWLDQWLRGAPAHWALSAGLLLQLLVGDASAVARLIVNGRWLVEVRGALPAICALLPADDTPVVSESAPVARLCGHRAAIQPFIMSDLATRGLWDQSKFVSALERGAYSAVILPFDLHPTKKVRAARWTPAMIEAMRRGYRLRGHHGRWRVLLPAEKMGF